MLQTSVLLGALVGVVSSQILEDILRLSALSYTAEKEIMENKKGYVKNCDPSESTFAMDWFPDPMIKGETVTVEGNYTFPEDFEEGEVRFRVKVGPIPLEKSFRLQCSDISEKPCKQGYTAVGNRTLTVPRDLPIPQDRKIKVEAQLINIETGNEIGCAEAEIEVVDGDDFEISFYDGFDGYDYMDSVK